MALIFLRTPIIQLASTQKNIIDLTTYRYSPDNQIFNIYKQHLLQRLLLPGVGERWAWHPTLEKNCNGVQSAETFMTNFKFLVFIYAIDLCVGTDK